MIKKYLHKALRISRTARRSIQLDPPLCARPRRIAARPRLTKDGDSLDAGHPEHPPYTIFEQ
jgi:hypothetical protein